jgi:Iap family predicted aminopeptidase
MNPDLLKWKKIATSFQETRKAEKVFDHIRQERTDLRIQLKEATQKYKRRAERHAKELAVVKEREQQSYEEKISLGQREANEEIARASNKWAEKNASLQAQLDVLKVTLKTAET